MKLIKWFPLPNGWKSRIACFFQTKFTVTSLVIVLNTKNEVLLFEHTYRSIPWGLPGGFVGKNEDPEVSVVREVFEESGLTISNLEILEVCLDSELSRLTVCYFSKDLRGTFKVSNEVSSVKFYAQSNLPNLPLGQKAIIRKALEIHNTTTQVV